MTSISINGDQTMKEQREVLIVLEKQIISQGDISK